jgi:hypothetical protein
MILSGVMLYTENILEEQLVQKFLSLLSINYDLEKEIPVFLNLKNFIYAVEITLAPIIIIFASKMRLSKWAYLFPLYAYTSALIGTILTYYGFPVYNLWYYRLAVIPAVLIAWWVLLLTIKYSEAKQKEEDLRDLILENYRKKLAKDGENQDVSKLVGFKTHEQIVVENIDDLQDFVRGWRSHFLTTMKPKHMPQGWSITYQHRYNNR